jgi:tetratricopeptide (TPR) repeat protein
VEEYRETPKSVPVIGKELGVRYLLAGGVQRAADRVRSNVQLIDTSDEGHLWAGLFDEVLNTENLFDIQTAITDSVASYLRVVIEGAEIARIAQRSTDNAEAYALYLESLTAAPSLMPELLSEARLPFVEEAVRLDPEFALAWTRQALLHARLDQLGREDANHAGLARAALEQAFRLAPDLPEAHYAHAMVLYRVEREYQRALTALDQAEAGRMRDLDISRSIIERRAGRWDEALLSGLRALKTYPRSRSAHLEVARTLHLSRRYDEAEPFYDAAMELEPTHVRTRRSRAEMLWHRDGDIEEYVGLVEERRYRGPYMRRDWTASILRLRELPDAVRLNDLRAESRDFYVGMAQRGSGDEAAAAEAFQNAVDTMEARVANDPDDFRLVEALGLAYAGTGQGDEALQAGRRGLELMPPKKDAIFGPWAYTRLAQIHAVLGQADSAVAYLERTFAIPGDLSAWDVKMDPIYDSIRDHPGYHALMERFGLEP